MTNFDIIKVVIPHINLHTLHYLDIHILDIKIGELVLLKLRNKIRIGIVIEVISKAYDPKKSINIYDESNKIKYKEIIKKINLKISQDMVNLLIQVSKYYCVPYGSVAKMLLPFENLLLKDLLKNSKY